MQAIALVLVLDPCHPREVWRSDVVGPCQRTSDGRGAFEVLLLTVQRLQSVTGFVLMVAFEYISTNPQLLANFALNTDITCYVHVHPLTAQHMP